MDRLTLTGERTLPGLSHEAYWFARHEVAYRWAARLVPRLGVVVDAGCGEGYGARVLAQAGARTVLALDLDATCVAHVARAHPPVRAVRANLVELPLRPASVDLVVALQTVEHLWDLPAFLSGCARALRPGGRLVVSTPNRLTFSPGLARGAKPANPFHARELDAAELAELLAPSFTRVRANAVVAGPRLRAWESARGSLVEAQLQQTHETWPPELADLVASVRADDFAVRPLAPDALDLLAVATVRPRSTQPTDQYDDCFARTGP